jgi:hypothetical protein
MTADQNKLDRLPVLKNVHASVVGSKVGAYLIIAPTPYLSLIQYSRLKWAAMVQHPLCYFDTDFFLCS